MLGWCTDASCTCEVQAIVRPGYPELLGSHLESPQNVAPILGGTRMPPSHTRVAVASWRPGGDDQAVWTLEGLLAHGATLALLLAVRAELALVGGHGGGKFPCHLGMLVVVPPHVMQHDTSTAKKQAEVLHKVCRAAML